MEKITSSSSRPLLDTLVRKANLAPIDPCEVVDQRLNGLHARVGAIARGDLAGQRLRAAGLAGNLLPRSRRHRAKPGDQGVKDGAHTPLFPAHGKVVNPYTGNESRDSSAKTLERDVDVEMLGYGIACMSSRDILAANLKALMESSEYRSLPALERATALKGCKVGKSTIDRALKGEANLTMDNLEAIAKVFGIDAWQLLVPGMQPKNPPVLRTIGPVEKDMYARFQQMAKEIAKLPGGEP